MKAFFGPNSERVIAFGARPVRPRTGKRPTEQVKPPAPGGSGAPGPEAAGAPRPPDEIAGKEEGAPQNPTAS